MRTIQLRRYTLVDGEYDAFLAWWQEWMPKVRPAAGFAIDFAYGLRATNEFVSQRNVQSRMIEEGADPAGGTPEQFGAFVRREYEKWRSVVRESGARVD